MSNIIFVAPPLAGKGTFSNLLASKYNMIHISMGELLRKEVSNGSDLGDQVKDLMNNGKLVDDDIVFRLLENRLKLPDCNSGYILDGFPRDLEQAIEFDELSKKLNREIDCVILIDVDREVALKRMIGRLSCKDCGTIYNEYTTIFEKPGYCNKCSGELFKRSDDNEETFNTRYEIYTTKTQPVIDYYKSKKMLHVVEGSSSDIMAIFREIEKVINGVGQ